MKISRPLIIIVVLAFCGVGLIYASQDEPARATPTAVVAFSTVMPPTATPVTLEATSTPSNTDAPTPTTAPTQTNTPTAEPASPTGTRRSPIKTGYSIRTFNYKNQIREYALYIPESYDGVTRFPMLVGFHPLNANIETFAIGMGWLAPAQEKKMIGVFPQGVKTPNEDTGSWNAIHCCGYAKQEQIDDIGFIRALVNYLRVQYLVDAKRIYATGYSNGGDMTHYVASEMSDVFAAAGEYAGAMGSTPGAATIVYKSPRTPISMIKLHGKRDEVRPFNGGWDAIHGMQYVSVNEATQFWVSANGCPRAATTGNVDGGTSETYSGCKNNTSVVMIAYNNINHDYPPSATKLIVDFLVKQTKP